MDESLPVDVLIGRSTYTHCESLILGDVDDRKKFVDSLLLTAPNYRKSLRTIRLFEAYENAKSLLDIMLRLCEDVENPFPNLTNLIVNGTTSVG
jgi:hypothetical protein